MSFRDSLEQLERRGLVQGILLILAIALILCSFWQIFSLEVYPYRLLLFLTGTILLAMDLYLIMTEEMPTKYGIAPERISKKPRMLWPTDIFADSLRASLYAVFLVCFFLIGLSFPILAWGSLLLFPLVLSFFCGYLVGNFKKAFAIILAGCIIGIIMALALFVVPFLEAYRSCFVDILESWGGLGPFTEEEIFGCAFLTIISYISFAVPFELFVAYVGTYVGNKHD